MATRRGGQRSRFYAADKRKSIISTRITGLNLEGTTVTSMLFMKKELKTTWFHFEYSIASFRWQMRRSFDEIKDFHALIQKDPSLAPGRSMLQASFPPGKDGDIDTMILLERREMIELFMKEVLSVVDFKVYEPLDTFIEGSIHLMLLQDKLRVVVRNLRSFVAKRKLNFRLFKHYSSDLLNFVYALEQGIEVVNVALCADKQFSNIVPEVWMLWLDVCEEPGLSRLCLAPKEIFNLPQSCEDERMSNGVFLSDIAEVRRGCSVSFFRGNYSTWIEPAACVNIVASERVMIMQMKDGGSAYRDIFAFIDMLNLLVLQALTPNEVQQRKKTFRRSNHRLYDVDVALVKSFTQRKPTEPNRVSRSSSNVITTRFLAYQSNLSAGSAVPTNAKERYRQSVQQESDGMTTLLLAGIEVDEEIFSPRFGTRVLPKILQFVPEDRLLLVKTRNATQTVEPPTPIQPHWAYMGQRPDHSASDRSISLDDICEIRAGKISDIIDHSMLHGDSAEVCFVTVIASESVIVLPITNKVVQENFIRKFHAFLEMNRDCSVYAEHTPSLFRLSVSSETGDSNCANAVDESPVDVDDALTPAEEEKKTTKSPTSPKEGVYAAHSNRVHISYTSHPPRSISAIRRSSSSKGGQSNSISESLHMIRNSSIDHF